MLLNWSHVNRPQPNHSRRQLGAEFINIYKGMKSQRAPARLYLWSLAVDKLRPPRLHVAMRVRVRRWPLLLLLLSGKQGRLSATLHRPRSHADRLVWTGALLGNHRPGAHVTRRPRPVLLLRRVDWVVGDGTSFTGVQRLTSGPHLQHSSSVAATN